MEYTFVRSNATVIHSISRLRPSLTVSSLTWCVFVRLVMLYLPPDLAADVYNIGGGQQVPENSEYLGCMRDEKHSYDARALFEGLLKCYDNMTTQV